MKRKTLAAAFPYTVPVLMGYLAIGVVFGWMLSAIGYTPLWSVAMSVTIYAGSGQYLGVSLLENAAPLADVAFGHQFPPSGVRTVHAGKVQGHGLAENLHDLLPHRRDLRPAGGS